MLISLTLLATVDKRVFAMLVIVFICTTVTVRPMSRFIYFSRAQDDSEGAEEGEKSDGTLQGETSTNEKTDGSGFHALAPVPDFPITVAITSPNPNIVALMTLLSIAGGGESHAASLASISSEEHEKAIGRVAVDLIRLLPLDYSTSSIMKLIVTSTDRRRDEMLETLKAFAGLIGVPTSASLAAERALFHETQHGGATITQHHALESVPLPADTFPVPDGERIEFIAKCNARAQNRLRVGSVPIDGSALGHGLTIVAWESSNAVARSLSWLGTAAAASGLSPADSEEEAFWRADADAHALPARLFRQLDSATGVLVDRQVLEHHADLPSRVRSQADLAKRARFERELGIVRTTGRRRVIVPFFGGADDRAAVELVKKLAASSGAIDAFVVAMLSTYAANDLGLLSMSSAEGGNSGTAALQHPPAASHLAVPSAAEAETHEAENQESINLRTIHRADMDRLDTLFLRTLGGLAQKPADQTIDEKGEDRQIARSSSSGSASEGVGAGAKPTNLSMTTPRPTVRVDSGVTFITLPSYGEGPIGSILSALLPLIDDLQDLVLVGRGKLAQRPKSFRAEVQAMHAAAASVATSNANADAENNGQRSAMGEGAKAELVQMGRTLGAAAEGLLLGGVTASLLVVQARRE